MSETTEQTPAVVEPVVEPAPDPRIAYRARLASIRGRAETAKRRLMLDELSDAVSDLAALVSETLG